MVLPPEVFDMIRVGEELLPASSKMDYIISQLVEITRENKVAIVSEWVQLLEIVQEHIAYYYPEIKVCRVDGKTSKPADRVQMIKQFEEVSNLFLRIQLTYTGP